MTKDAHHLTHHYQRVLPAPDGNHHETNSSNLQVTEHFGKVQQMWIVLACKSAGSGFESLAAHISPGHASALGFFMPSPASKRSSPDRGQVWR